MIDLIYSEDAGQRPDVIITDTGSYSDIVFALITAREEHRYEKSRGSFGLARTGALKRRNAVPGPSRVRVRVRVRWRGRSWTG